VGQVDAVRWQVRRSELDELLFPHAAAKGARTFEGQRVREVAFDGDGATPSRARRRRAAQLARALRRRRLRARHLLANQLRCKEKNKRHNSSALYGHFTGAERLPGKLEGNITIFWFEHGWFWFIPLADGTTSVGAVCWPYYLKSRQQAAVRVLSPTRSRCARHSPHASPTHRSSMAASTRPATTRTRARRAAASASS
jgi:flavin-dependent dehydrogenase